MNSRQLHYFRTVVDHGSFTHAAESLDMTQPSLSLAVRKLEQDLNVQLLSRNRTGVTTTQAGRYLYGVALEVANLLATAEARLADFAEDAPSSES
ncbi:LysR family transcriptional regulator [Corynebacterium sp.]|uniref:LysR family transcriptional regulator n=1 Tax=Corynebacterium sp. TaxID=1720 RepID=UPI0026DD08E3|nr:LysR family transcriptional regulator [Corynebacterium sp.]MDO5032913.1 LysR family transcriptional regulator [Corynebacterium sp.]